VGMVKGLEAMASQTTFMDIVQNCFAQGFILLKLSQRFSGCALFNS